MTSDPYGRVHRSLRRTRGPARNYPCISCGDPAVDWAYQHTGESFICERRRRPYSVSIDDYAPMCRGCHQYLDNEKRGPDAPKVRIKARRKCLGCNLITTPAAMSLHLKFSRHDGFTKLPSVDQHAHLDQPTC